MITSFLYCSSWILSTSFTPAQNPSSNAGIKNKSTLLTRWFLIHSRCIVSFQLFLRIPPQISKLQAIMRLTKNQESRRKAIYHLPLPDICTEEASLLLRGTILPRCQEFPTMTRQQQWWLKKIVLSKWDEITPRSARHQQTPNTCTNSVLTLLCHESRLKGTGLRSTWPSCDIFKSKTGSKSWTSQNSRKLSLLIRCWWRLENWVRTCA